MVSISLIILLWWRIPISPLVLFVKKSATLSLVFTYFFSINPSSTNSFTNPYLISTCLVLLLVVTFSDINIAPTLSNITVIGKLTSRLMIFSNIQMNFNSLTYSDNAMYSASLDLNVTLRCALEHQLIGTWFKIIINPDTLILDSLLPANSLSLYATIFMIFYFFFCVISNPLFPASITYLITRFISFILFPMGPSFNLFNFLTAFVMYGRVCFTSYSNIPTQVLYH